MSEEKTFTQEQLDGIIQERLAKEKAKYDTVLAEKEKELAAREFQMKAKETLTAKGLSPDLLEALNTSSPEAFERSLSLLEDKLTSPSPTGMKVSTGGSHTEPGGGPSEDIVIRNAMGLNKE